MSKSPYTDKVILTSKHSGKRKHKVQAFVLHHMAAVWTGERCATYLRDTPSREASANYYIGHAGDVVLGVEEENRAWTSSSNWADQRALTFELANEKRGYPWKISDKTLDKTIKMLAELHKRYGLKECTYTGDTSGTLWRHDWFAKTNCPGPYLGGKLPYIAKEVNKILNGQNEDAIYIVKKGDMLSKIAEKYEVSVNDLVKENDIKNPNIISIGQKITIPVESPKADDVKPSASKPSTSPTIIAGAKLVKVEDGYFLATENIKVRSRPTVKATHTGTFPKGESLHYKRVFQGNGYRWLEYTGNSGATLYIPYRRLSGETSNWGTFHSERPHRKSVSELADEVDRGLHGDGDERKESLGDRYAEVQKEIERRYR